MGVDAKKKRPGDALGFAVVADGLRDRQHMPFVERAVERRAAVPRGAEGDALSRDRRVGRVNVVSSHELAHIDQH